MVIFMILMIYIIVMMPLKNLQLIPEVSSWRKKTGGRSTASSSPGDEHDDDDVGGDAGDDDGEDNDDDDDVDDDDDDDTSISPKGTALVATPNLPRPGSHLKSIASENAGNRGLTLGRFGRSWVSSSFKLLAPALSSDGTWFGNSQWMTFIFIIHEKSS